MVREDLEKIVRDIVAQGQILMRKFTRESAPVNYACVFCHNDEEYGEFLAIAKQMGKIMQETQAGPIFKIDPLFTVAGSLRLLKIRKPDSTRPERGDADFTLSDYNEFKKIHLGQKGFSLIDKGNFEMIELVDPNFNVRVYFSDPPLDKQLGLI